MTSPDACYLLDVNTLIARVFEDHIHHGAAKAWFGTPGLQWALCPFTEAGFLRYASDPGRGGIGVHEATAILEKLTEHPGYRFQPVAEDWRTVTRPFFQRLHGHKQITDAFLLGIAVREGFILTTFDRGILHMAGEHSSHVLVLTDS